MLSIYPCKTVSNFNLPSLLFLWPNTKFKLLQRTSGSTQVHTQHTEGKVLSQMLTLTFPATCSPVPWRSLHLLCLPPTPHSVFYPRLRPAAAPARSPVKLCRQTTFTTLIFLDLSATYQPTQPLSLDPVTHTLTGRHSHPWCLVLGLVSPASPTFSPEVIASAFTTCNTICTSMISKYFSPLSFRDCLASFLNISQAYQT